MGRGFRRVLFIALSCWVLQLAGLAHTASAASTATFLRFDNTTQGNWKGVYGNDGHSIATDTTTAPSYATFSVINQGNGLPSNQAVDTLTWATNPTDIRALQSGNPTGTVAGAWFVDHFAYPPTFSFNINITDGNTHQLAIYFIDWDNEHRGESVQITDANTNAVLDTRYMSDFVNGIYAVWNVSGHVLVTVTTTSGENSQAVASGVFFGGGNSGTYSVAINPASANLNSQQSQQFTATVGGTISQNVIWSINPSFGSISSTGLYTAPASFSNGQIVTVTAASVVNPTQTSTARVTLTTGPVANYVGSDAATQGNWPTLYGVDGYAIAGDSQSIPSYGSFALQGQSNTTWAANPSDTRALKTGNELGRIAAGWTSSSSFSFSANVTDGNLHQISLYALDWNNQGIQETIKAIDPSTNTVIDTRSISNFSQGVYLVWNISGNVTFQVTQTAGGTALLSGVFWGHGDTISISVNPQSALLTAGQSAQFTATVLGSPVSNVIWSLNPPSLGTITTTGLYVAPTSISSNQTVTVTATSVEDPSRSGSAYANLTTGAAANFIGADTTTQGNWLNKYGADGYAMVNQSATNSIVTEVIPSYANLNIQSPDGFTRFWAFSTTDPRALELPSGSDRIAAAWWMYRNHVPFYFDVNFTDGNSHQLSFYSVDFDGTGRISTYEIRDANTGAILDTRTISNYTQGLYLIWQVSGHVTVNITEEAGTDAVVSGLFFGGATQSIGTSVTPTTASLEAGQTLQFAANVSGTSNPTVNWSIVSPAGPTGGSISSTGLYQAPSTVSQAHAVTIAASSVVNGTNLGYATINLSTKTSAGFVGYDTTTEGSWYGQYGFDGFAIPNYLQNIPSYATFAVQNQTNSTWVANTADPRALLTGNYTGRIASNWDATSSFTFDINFGDTNSHQLALYALDWDSATQGLVRTETLQVIDATTNALLDTRTITNFVNGTYVIWNVTGHVKINVTQTNSGSAVISGVFFGGTKANPPFVTVTPQTVGLGSGHSQQFTAQVINGTPGVAWAITNPGPSTGTISPSGLYKAPSSVSSNQAVSVTATGAGGIAGSATVNLTTGAIANFLGLDLSTQGNWHGLYGTDGYALVNDSQGLPAYAALDVQNASTNTWIGDTTQIRALQTATGAGRIAADWYAYPNFSFDVNVSDGSLHEVALYLLDWDSAGGARSETITVTDANTNAILDTQNISSFVGGVYVPWNISGHVKIKVIINTGSTAVVSAVFFGAASSSNPIRLSVSPQNVTLAGGQNQQFSANVTGTLNQGVTWAIANGGLGNISAATGFYTAPATVTTNQTVTITGTSAADNTVAGSAFVHLTSGAAANFVRLDTVTHGNWQSAYGQDGYAIPALAQTVPTYAGLSILNAGNIVWAATSTDVRAVRIPGASNGIASNWSTVPAFTFDVNINDGKSHQVAVYALDWDSSGGIRAENVQVVDATTNSVLDNQNISTFTGGVYLVWNISGHVKINFTMTAGLDAVASGVFFGGPVSNAPVFTTPNAATFAIGSAGKSTISASGTPAPSFSESGSLPNGVSFSDNSNGTASLHGTPATGTSGSYPITLTASNGVSPNATQSFTLTVNQTAIGNTATFAGQDLTTQGNWQIKYGADGYAIPNYATQSIKYGSFSTQGATLYNWAAPTTDVRAPMIPGSSFRVAPAWTAPSSFSFDVNLTDGNAHRVALYALDWDSAGGIRGETVQIVDANTSSVLDTESVTNFQNGTYLVWNISGHVKINVTYTAGANAVVSGLFFGTPPQGTSAFVGFDTATEGNWQGKYGSDGYSIANSVQSLPGYATFASQNAQLFTWTSSTTDVRALTLPSGSSRIASAWYTKPNFSYDVNFTDGNTHQIALYALDWDNSGRSEIVQIVDATNPSRVIDTETVTNCVNGVYMVWNLSGHVTINVNWTGGPNALINGVFFGVPVQIAPSFTSGNGTTFLVGNPGTFTVTATGSPTPAITESGTLPTGVTFNTSTGVLSGTPASGSAPTYSITFTASNGVSPVATQTFTLMVSTQAPLITSANSTTFTVGTPGIFTVRATGAPSPTFSETGVLPTGITLNTTTGVLSGTPASGTAGSYPITLTANNGVSPNGTQNFTLIVNAAAAGPLVSFVGADTATQGNWQSKYGADGYSLASSVQSLPSYAAFTPQNTRQWTWAASTSDARALRLPNSTQALVAGWYNNPTFSFDVNFTDGNSHQIALYSLDWDSTARSEMVQITDTNGNPLDSESISSYFNGVYLVWNVSGHVIFNVTRTAGANAVVNGVFFGAPPQTAPSITSANSTTFSIGTAGSFTVTATGSPTPGITESGALPTGVTFNTSTGVLSGTPAAGTANTYPITITANNGVSPNGTQNFTLTVNAAAAGPHVSFVGADTATQGNWQSKYGADGYSLASSVQSLPAYATFTPQNTRQWTWAASTSDARALRLPTSTQALVAGWYNNPTFSFDVNFTDGNSHQIALYSLDWDSTTRSEMVQITDTNGNPLDSESLSSYFNGVYLVWNVSGHVIINVNCTGGANAVVNGVFFGAPPQTAPAITSANSTTFSIGTAGSFTVTATGSPTPAITESGALPTGVTFNTSTGVLSGTPATGTAGGYPITFTASNGVSPVATQNFTLTVAATAPTITSANSTTFTVGSAGTFTVTATGSPTITFSESGALPTGVTLNTTTGVLSGTPAAGTANSYPITITANNGVSPNGSQNFTLTVNAQSSGGPSASFLGPDTATQGNWQSRYGADGYSLAGFGQALPSYATLTPQNALSYTWANGSSDARALRLPGSSLGIVASWYNNPSFSFDVNFTDGNAHQIALYALDWDSTTRAESIQIVDGNNPSNILDTESIASFSNGVYLVWTVKGHVTINVLRTGGANGVVNGILFGSGGTATFLGTDTTTQGNWTGKYGTDGYSIANGAESIPSYAGFGVQNGLSFTWAAGTTDVRALLAPGGGTGSAATWYNNPSFYFNVTVSGGTHPIALYLLDWDGQNTRAETIQVTDANSGAVLDTETVSSFSNGIYLRWNITGSVRITFTGTGGPNAVASALFFK